MILGIWTLSTFAFVHFLIYGRLMLFSLCHKHNRCSSEKEIPRLVSPDMDKLYLWAVPQYKL